MSYLKLFQMFYPSLAKDMQDCSHHYDEKNLNPFHIEGSVFTHTALVTKELEGTDLEKAAVLHDIGKTQTRWENHEKKRVRFSGHENMSAFMSLSIFKDWKLTQEEKIRHFELIAMHGEPYRMEHDKLQQRLVNKPILANDLYRFGLADHRGRFHEGPDKHATNMLTAPTREIVKKDKEVVFMIGLPGSGKTTYIQNNLKDHREISRDYWIEGYDKTNYNNAWKIADQKAVDGWVEKELNSFSKCYDKIVVDMTNMSRKSRAKRLKYFEGFYKKAIVLLPDLLTTFDRLQKRPDKTIPEDVIKKMITGFNIPDLLEFDSVEYIFS